MNSLHVLLLLLALVALLAAALDVRAPRVNLLAAGLALWLLSILITEVLR